MALSVSLAHDLEPGEVICEDFAVERVLHAVPLGRMFEARASSGGPERYTVLCPHTSGRGADEGFRRQMERVATVQHRALAPIVDFAVGRAGPMVITRALTQGTTLREALTEGPLTRAEVGWVVCEVAAALEAFHALRPPVAHRALCPELISLARGGRGVQVDGCGLLDALGATGWIREHAEDFTDASYLSPDVLLDRVDPRMDTFVLASIAYECLTGARAFADPHDHTAVLKGPYPRACAALPDLNPDVDEVLQRAWTPTRDRAFETTSAFAMELAQALVTDAPAHSRPPTLPQMKPGQSGMRRAPSDPAARPIAPAASSQGVEGSFQEVEEALNELWPSEVPGTRRTFDWGAVAEHLGPPAQSRSTPPQRPLGGPPVRLTSPFASGAPSPVAPARTPPAAHPPGPSEPPTLAPPPSYPAWAGRVSRPNASVDALPATLPSMASPAAPALGAAPSHPTPSFVGPPVAPAARPDASVPATPHTPVEALAEVPLEAPVDAAVSQPARVAFVGPPASSDIPVLAPLAPTSVPSVQLRRSQRAPRIEPVFASRLPRAILRGLVFLGVSMVFSAVIVTAGQVYIARHGRVAPTITVTPSPVTPTITVHAPVAAAPVAAQPVAPPPVAAPPVAAPPVAQPPVAQPPVAQPPVAQPPVALPPVAQPPVAQPPADDAPAAPPAAETPAVVAEGPLQPFAGISAAFRAQMESAVTPCFGAVRGHHMRFRVRYAPSGTPSVVAVRGVFSALPNAQCIETAARALELPHESRGVSVVDYVYARPLRTP